ncbi:MAG: hypothetical protein LBB90_10750 [Tannerella sp.]|jgi:Fe-only nitrogenase accessory protein AnfO|nr:hypothetical protein [Tannerella sp.]
MKIAAFIDNEGNTLPFDSRGMVCVYEKGDEWTLAHKTPFYISHGMKLADVRKSLHELAFHLAGCRALIVKRCAGIFGAICEEELHIRIFVAVGSPLAVLDRVKDAVRTEVMEALKNVERCKQHDSEIRSAVEGGSLNGCFRINLVKVQEKNASMNSKDILLPFFEKNKFTELEIICLHTPKWIERELTNLNFRITTEIRNDGFCHTFVYPVN